MDCKWGLCVTQKYTVLALALDFCFRDWQITERGCGTVPTLRRCVSEYHISRVRYVFTMNYVTL